MLLFFRGEKLMGMLLKYYKLQRRKPKCIIQKEIRSLLLSHRLRRQHYKKSISTLQQFIQLVPYHSNLLQELVIKIECLDRDQKYALLVGINDYMNSNIGKVKGAINDVNALKNLLIQKFHFKEENISVLLNEQATYESILKSFDSYC